MSDAWYAEWAVHRELWPFVVCTWASSSGDRAPAVTDHIVPDGCSDIVWNGVDAFIAGPDTRPVPKVWVAGASCAGIRFRPGAAGMVFGLPLSELRDQRVALADVWKGDVGKGVGNEELGKRDLGKRDGAAAIVDRLACTSTPIGAARELEALIADRCRAASPPDPLVQAAIAAIVARPGRGVGLLPDWLGVTERTLRRRVSEAVGYGPKRLARIVRFRRFLVAAHDRPAASLAALAADVGYADQAHLSRECTALAGVTPTELLRTRHVRSVQDGLVTDDASCGRRAEPALG